MTPNITQRDFETKLPSSVARIANNFNHLHEQPTQFYAVALTLALLGVDDGTTVGLGWAYVGLRIVHSLVQATVNHIPTRFTLFASSGLVLLGMTGRAASVLF